MVKQATRGNREAIAAGRVLVRVGPSKKLVPSMARFTKVFSVNVIQFMPDKTAFFRLRYAELPCGGIIATTYEPRNKNPTRGDAIAMADRISLH
jgi:hypothetical protein